MESNGQRWLRTVGMVLIWLVTVVEVAGLGVAGWSKFGNPEVWTGMFESWGYPAWFAFVIGASEMAGATLLLLPRLATYAAVFLAVIMLGALATDIVVGALGAGTPLFHLVALVIIAFSRRNQRRRPGPRSA